MAGQVRGRSPTEYGLPTCPKLTDIEITQARDLDVECVLLLQCGTDPNARHGASARPSLGLAWLGLTAVAARDLVDAVAVHLFRSELQLEPLAHHAGQEATHRVLLPVIPENHIRA